MDKDLCNSEHARDQSARRLPCRPWGPRRLGGRDADEGPPPRHTAATRPDAPAPVWPLARAARGVCLLRAPRPPMSMRDICGGRRAQPVSAGDADGPRRIVYHALAQPVRPGDGWRGCASAAGGAGQAGPGAWPRGRGGGLHRRPQVIRVALRRRAPHAWRPSRRLRRRLKTSPTAGARGDRPWRHVPTPTQSRAGGPRRLPRPRAADRDGSPRLLARGARDPRGRTAARASGTSRAAESAVALVPRPCPDGARNPLPGPVRQTRAYRAGAGVGRRGRRRV